MMDLLDDYGIAPYWGGRYIAGDRVRPKADFPQVMIWASRANLGQIRSRQR